MTNSQNAQGHEHYNGICKKEFDRGYAFGRRESYQELMRMKDVTAAEDYPNNVVIFRVPKEHLVSLQKEVEQNL